MIILINSYACKNSASIPFNRDVVIDEVKNTLFSYAQDISKGGLLQEFKYLDSSDQFYWIPPGYNSALSYDSVKSILVRAAPVMKSTHNVYENLKVYPLSHENANYTAIVKSVSIDTSNKEYKSTLIESGSMIKRKDGWRLLSGHTSMVE